MLQVVDRMKSDASLAIGDMAWIGSDISFRKTGLMKPRKSIRRMARPIKENLR